MAYEPKARMRVDESQAKTLHGVLKQSIQTTESAVKYLLEGSGHEAKAQKALNDQKALLRELERTMQDFGWAP